MFKFFLNAADAMRKKDYKCLTHPLKPEDIARCICFVITRSEHVRIPKIMVLPGEHQI
jgi:NADP-dependent 3-hydroxy acid dehydrogenase YdfG